MTGQNYLSIRASTPLSPHILETNGVRDVYFRLSTYTFSSPAFLLPLVRGGAIGGGVSIDGAYCRPPPCRSPLVRGTEVLLYLKLGKLIVLIPPESRWRPPSCLTARRDTLRLVALRPPPLPRLAKSSSAQSASAMSIQMSAH